MTRTLLYRLAVVLFAGMLCSCSSDESDPLTVLVLGDSISGTANYPGVPPWPSLLGDIEPKWTILNRATAGERMAGGRAKVESALQNTQPDVLVIFYGTNNAILGDLEGFEEDLRATIQSGKQSGARVMVCTVPAMYGARTLFNPRVSFLNSTIRSAAPAEGATVVDVFKELGTDNPEMFLDGVHPDLDGQRIIAISVSERIKGSGGRRRGGGVK